MLLYIFECAAYYTNYTRAASDQEYMVPVLKKTLWHYIDIANMFERT